MSQMTAKNTTKIMNTMNATNAMNAMGTMNAMAKNAIITLKMSIIIATTTLMTPSPHCERNET